MYFKTVGRKSKAGNAESAERVEERRSETKSCKHRFTTIDTSILSIYMSIEFADFFEENDLFVKYVYVKSVSYRKNSRNAKICLKTRVYYDMMLVK